MASSKKLSTDEVEALIGGLADEEAAGVDLQRSDVRPVSLGLDDLSVLGDYYALRMINERFCRLCRSVFLPMLRSQPKLSAFPPEIKKFSDYKSEKNDFMSFTISKVESLKGTQLLALDPEMVSALTSSYYGGSVVKSLRNVEGEFTATEHRIIEMVTVGMNEALAAAWSDLIDLSFDVILREENVQQTTFSDDDETVIICGFMLQFPDNSSSRFDVLYPLQMLKPIASQLRTRLHTDTGDLDLTWKQKLEHAVLNVPVTLTAELARPKISFGRLTQVRKDEVLPIMIGDGVEVRIQGRQIFRADLGSASNRAAVELKKRTKRDGEQG